MRILIAGCGWLGRALGASLIQDGHQVVGVRRNAEACRLLESEGLEALQCDLAAAGASRALPDDVDLIVASQAAGVRDADGYRVAYIQAMAPLIELAQRGRVQRLVFTSSTGVFGQDDESEVDETSPTQARTPTGEVLVEAEQRLLEAASRGLPACVVRLSGLYGPERYGVIDRVRSGKLALGPSDSAWMNWCHQEDAVRTVRALCDRGEPGRIYHATDAEPTRRRDVVRWISGRLGIQPPAAAPAGVVGAAGRRSANRRVSGQRTRDALGITLAFPSYRDGLEAAVSAAEHPDRPDRRL